VNTAIKGDELSLKYVELAVRILQDPPTPESENLRSWAIEVINSYSDVKLPEAAISELQNVPIAESRSDVDNARVWEARAFDALLARDIGLAIQALTSAEMAWPTYHNVAEIRDLLMEERTLLADPSSDEWRHVYRRILTSYSWGMPEGVQEQMDAYTKRSSE
jgi:hypothetical protein